MSGTEYSEQFYSVIADGCRQSAEVVVPLVLSRFWEQHACAPDCPTGHGGTALTVVDVGSGQGWWGAEFARLGCDVVGVDGAYVRDPQIPFLPRDLALPLDPATDPDLGRYDIAVCLEVAEHLPESRARSFVADLCALFDFVVFSAAIPHQGGANHVNCQHLSWWADLFREHGYGADGQFRFQFWADDRVEGWYRGNICLAIHGGAEIGPLDVVHPVLYSWLAPN